MEDLLYFLQFTMAKNENEKNLLLKEEEKPLKKKRKSTSLTKNEEFYPVDVKPIALKSQIDNIEKKIEIKKEEENEKEKTSLYEKLTKFIPKDVAFFTDEDNIRKDLVQKILSNPDIDYETGNQVIEAIMKMSKDKLEAVSLIVDIKLCEKTNPNVAKNLLSSIANFCPVKDKEKFIEECNNDEDMVNTLKNAVAPYYTRLGLPLKFMFLFAGHLANNFSPFPQTKKRKIEVDDEAKFD